MPFITGFSLPGKMHVPHIYVPLRKKPKRIFGYAEAKLKRRLERLGWTVWRAELVGILRTDEDLYPNVLRKYRALAQYLITEWPGRYDMLCYINAVHHGMPDLICRRSTLGGVEWKFVECKLFHEQLSMRQRKCIAVLNAMGFAVEVHKLANDGMKARRALVDIESGKRSVIERQLRLTRRPRAARESLRGNQYDVEPASSDDVVP